MKKLTFVKRIELVFWFILAVAGIVIAYCNFFHIAPEIDTPVNAFIATIIAFGMFLGIPLTGFSIICLLDVLGIDVLGIHDEE